MRQLGDIAQFAAIHRQILVEYSHWRQSVAINVMLLSLLYKAPPSEVRLILVDPKMLELSIYEDIPHLLPPVVTDINEGTGTHDSCYFLVRLLPAWLQSIER